MKLNASQIIWLQPAKCCWICTLLGFNWIFSHTAPFLQTAPLILLPSAQLLGSPFLTSPGVDKGPDTFLGLISFVRFFPKCWIIRYAQHMIVRSIGKEKSDFLVETIGDCVVSVLIHTRAHCHPSTPDLSLIKTGKALL